MTREPWPTKGPDYNTWNMDLSRFVSILDGVEDHGWWTQDWQLKYLNIRVDTRDNAFVLTARAPGEEDNQRISPDRVIDAIEAWKKRLSR